MNHNDMEGVFRDAAENYQVRTDKAYDWDKVNKAVHKNTGSNDEPSRKPDKKDKRRFVFWLFFLVSSGVFLYSIWRAEFSGHYAALNQSQKVAATKHKAENKNQATDDNKQLKEATSDDQIVSNKKNEQNKEGIATQNTKDETGNKQQVILTKNNVSQDKIETSSIKNKEAPLINNKTETNLLPDKSGYNDLLANNNAKNDKENNLLSQPLPLNKSKGEEKISKNENDTSQSNKVSPQLNAVANKKNTNKKEHGFYAGVQAAPDITFIKFQKSNGVGIEFGLTGGYQLNNRWSIETGAFLNTKKYYTKGEYFDKSKEPSLYGVDLVSVSGKCTMIELPLNVRYRFAANNKQNFSLAVGASSYLMTREYYDYTVKTMTSYENQEQTYHSSSKNLFATISLSAGYERKLNNTLTFKAEPYFKIPVSGIGTGKLNMSSTGINFGVTKYFGKK